MTDDLTPFVEFGTGWAKIHFRREVTEQDRAALAALYAAPAQGTSKCPRCLCAPLHCNCEVYPVNRGEQAAWRWQVHGIWHYATYQGFPMGGDGVEPLYVAAQFDKAGNNEAQLSKQLRSDALQALADSDRDLICDRPELSYLKFRSGFPDPALRPPPWEDLPSYVRDAVTVGYLQGKLDGKQ